MSRPLKEKRSKTRRIIDVVYNLALIRTSLWKIFLNSKHLLIYIFYFLDDII